MWGGGGGWGAGARREQHDWEVAAAVPLQDLVDMSEAWVCEYHAKLASSAGILSVSFLWHDVRNEAYLMRFEVNNTGPEPRVEAHVLINQGKKWYPTSVLCMHITEVRAATAAEMEAFIESPFNCPPHGVAGSQKAGKRSRATVGKGSRATVGKLARGKRRARPGVAPAQPQADGSKALVLKVLFLLKVLKPLRPLLP